MQNAEQRAIDLRLVLRTLREMTDIKVDIYFTAVGMIDIPTEKEILATMEEIRNNPQDFKFVA